MKRLLMWLAALASGLAFALPASAQDRALKIGIVTLQMKAPYFVAMVRSLEAEAAKHKNVSVLVADGNGDVAKVSSDIEDLLAKGVDGLIMNISPLEALPGPMAAIKKAGKPVVLVNRKLAGGEYDAWVGVDNRAIGAGLGEVIVRHMGGKGVLMMMRGGPEDNSTGNARRDGVLSKVMSSGIQVVVAPEFGRWGEDGGIRVMEDMLAKHQQIDAVFCENDAMCLGAQKAIADAKRDKAISVFGFDGQKAAIDQITKGTNYVATGQNSPEAIARIGMDKLFSLIAGRTVPKDTVTPVVVVTKENAATVANPRSVF